MKIKLFWQNTPVRFGVFGAYDANAISWENEINAWLREHPHVKITDIRQSATGGFFVPTLWWISVWYEEGDSQSNTASPMP